MTAWRDTEQWARFATPVYQHTTGQLISDLDAKLRLRGVAPMLGRPPGADPAWALDARGAHVAGTGAFIVEYRADITVPPLLQRVHAFGYRLHHDDLESKVTVAPIPLDDAIWMLEHAEHIATARFNRRSRFLDFMRFFDELRLGPIENPVHKRLWHVALSTTRQRAFTFQSPDLPVATLLPPTDPTRVADHDHPATALPAPAPSNALSLVAPNAIQRRPLALARDAGRDLLRYTEARLVTLALIIGYLLAIPVKLMRPIWILFAPTTLRSRNITASRPRIRQRNRTHQSWRSRTHTNRSALRTTPRVHPR